jgi:hypothetical protein
MISLLPDPWLQPKCYGGVFNVRVVDRVFLISPS